MRTTIDLDDDIASALKPLAAASKRSLGRVVSDLVREALEAKAASVNVEGFPVFAVSPTASVFGPDEVRQALEE
jgi:hypothetical protein